MRTNKAKATTAPIHTHEGARAVKISLEKQLERSVLSTMLFEGTFYEDGKSISNRIDSLAAQVDPHSVADLARKARGEGNLRHVPLRLALALVKRKFADADQVVADVIQRPDEMAELLSQYFDGKKKPLANSLKRGLASAFVKFDKYQISKYRGIGDTISLRDVMFLVHPDPSVSPLPYEKKRQLAGVYKKLANNELEAPETWEKQSSAGKDQKAVFTDLINSNKLGAMAMLRNLRNMQQAGVSDDVIRKGLANMNIERVLPFRFISASKYAPKFEPELEEAMFKCLELEDKLPGKTVMLIDVSGSMAGAISAKSDLTRLDAASAVAMMLRELCSKVEIYTFESGVQLVPARRGFALRAAIGHPRGGTDTGAAVRKANSVGYDRCIVITDEQSHTSIEKPKGLGYFINVASYQNGIGYGNWVHVDGWSDAVVRWVSAYESEILD